jgi:hypothetical protein
MLSNITNRAPAVAPAAIPARKRFLKFNWLSSTVPNPFRSQSCLRAPWHQVMGTVLFLIGAVPISICCFESILFISSVAPKPIRGVLLAISKIPYQSGFDPKITTYTHTDTDFLGNCPITQGVASVRPQQLFSKRICEASGRSRQQNRPDNHIKGT